MDTIHVHEHQGVKTASFFCPGCKTFHAVRAGNGDGPTWDWNGSTEKPTFFPSVLATSGHYVPNYDGKGCWCTYYQEHPEDEDRSFVCYRCHSFVENGMIRFLNDCTHALAGQTVPLPEYPKQAE